MIKNYYIHDDNCKPELPIANYQIDNSWNTGFSILLNKAWKYN